MHVIEELSLIVQTLCWFQNRSFKYCAAFDKLTCLDCLLSNLPLITFQNIARSFVVLIIYFVIFFSVNTHNNSLFHSYLQLVFIYTTSLHHIFINLPC